MKSKGFAYLLWLLSIFGWLGFHRFYLGKIGTGILWILTLGVGGIGSLVDLFTLGGQVDAYNNKKELKKIKKNLREQERFNETLVEVVETNSENSQSIDNQEA